MREFYGEGRVRESEKEGVGVMEGGRGGSGKNE